METGCPRAHTEANRSQVLSRCLVCPSQPVEGIVQITVRRKFEDKPARSPHQRRRDSRVGAQSRAYARSRRSQFERQRIRRSHSLSSRKHSKNIFSAIQRCQSEHRASRDTWPCPQFLAQRPRPSPHLFRDRQEFGIPLPGLFRFHGKPIPSDTRLLRAKLLKVRGGPAQSPQHGHRPSHRIPIFGDYKPQERRVGPKWHRRSSRGRIAHPGPS